jgi:hypothetical protein
MALRYFLFWLPMPFLGVLNGTLRELVLKQYLHEVTAQHVSAFTLIVLILAYGLFIRKKLALHSRSDAAYCSVTWVALTLLFEFGFGYFVGHHSFQTMLLDYYIWEGKLWPVVIIFTGLVPFILRKL